MNNEGRAAQTRDSETRMSVGPIPRAADSMAAALSTWAPPIPRAQAGVRSFGIDDILGHTSVTSVARRGAGLGRSPLDALFTMTTNFDSLKQKSGAKMQIPARK